MPSIERPNLRTMLPGLGLAGSLLTAVIAASALTSAFVAFSVWPRDPSSGSQATLTLDAPATATTGRGHRPVVLRAPQAASGAGATAGSATAAPAGAPGGRGRSRPAATAGARVRRTSPSVSSGLDGPEPIQLPQPRLPSPRAQQAPLAAVGGTVDATTRALARSLGSVTAGLADAVTPVSPQLGDTVRGAGDGLSSTVAQLGSSLAALLGHRPPPPTSALVARPGMQDAPPPDG